MLLVPSQECVTVTEQSQSPSDFGRRRCLHYRLMAACCKVQVTEHSFLVGINPTHLASFPHTNLFPLGLAFQKAVCNRYLHKGAAP